MTLGSLVITPPFNNALGKFAFFNLSILNYLAAVFLFFLDHILTAAEGGQGASGQAWVVLWHNYFPWMITTSYRTFKSSKFQSPHPRNSSKNMKGWMFVCRKFMCLCPVQLDFEVSLQGSSEASLRIPLLFLSNVHVKLKGKEYSSYSSLKLNPALAANNTQPKPVILSWPLGQTAQTHKPPLGRDWVMETTVRTQWKPLPCDTKNWWILKVAIILLI